MKRSPLVRKTPLQRGKPLARGNAIARKNLKRSAKAFARNYGDEAALVRAMPCLAARRGLVRCHGDVCFAHVDARGMGGCGGGRFDGVPLCARHHEHAGELRTLARSTFETLYGLDLRAEADRIALAHSEPLGIRGLARRWAVGDGPMITTTAEEWASAQAMADRGIADYQGKAAGEGWPGAWTLAPLGDYERSALFGWVRRALERSPAGKAARQLGQREHEIRGAMLLDLDLPLSINDLGALADAAGWPA